MNNGNGKNKKRVIHGISAFIVEKGKLQSAAHRPSLPFAAVILPLVAHASFHSF